MALRTTWGGSPFAINPSANSMPSGFSAAAEMMRIGTSGFSSFISLAISVPVLSVRKWSAITNSIGYCLKSSKPPSPELAVSTLKPTLASRNFLTRSEMSSSSIHSMRGRRSAVDDEAEIMAVPFWVREPIRSCGWRYPAMRQPLFEGFANIVILPNNLGSHELLQRRLVVDGQDTSLEFD